MTKSAGYPPQVLKEMLQVTYNEEASGYDEERFKERQHDVRLMRLIKELLPKYIVGNEILELACGTGYCGGHLKELGYEYRGIVISDELVRIGREKGLVVVQGDVEEPYVNAPILDTIFCIKAFGFFTNPIKVLKNIKYALKPGGRFINFYYNNRYHNAIVRLYSLFKDPDNISYQPPWDERYTWRQYKTMLDVVGMELVYVRDCVVLPYKIIPRSLHPMADRIDSKLTHFGFVTMAVSKK